MRKFLIATVLLFTAFPAHTQQQVPQSPMEQAMAQKLMEEINTNLQLRSQLVQANEKIKQLEDAKKPPEAKK